MDLPDLEANFPSMRVVLLVRTEQEAQQSIWPVIPNHIVECTTFSANVVGLCDATGARVVVAFASEATSALFCAIQASRPGVQRVLVVPDDTVANALRAINASPSHYVLMGEPSAPPTAAAVSEALNVLDERLPVAGAVPGSVSASSLNAQSLARRRRLAQLSQREREILLHLAKGARIATISEVLHLSTHTVRNHIKGMFRKLDVHSQAELVALARRRSLRPGD